MAHPLFNEETVGRLEATPFQNDVARNPSSLNKILLLEMERPDPLKIYGAPKNLKYEVCDVMKCPILPSNWTLNFVCFNDSTRFSPNHIQLYEKSPRIPWH